MIAAGRPTRSLPLWVTLSLAACGGGGDNTPAPTDPAPVQLSGTVVINGPVQGGVVCLDLNRNGACDSGEPGSAATGSDGAYSLTYDPASLDADTRASAPLIAPQTASTIDTGSGLPTASDSAFVLTTLPGRAGQINPLTTLVAKAVDGGMSEADARSNLAQQLGMPAGKIDDYQTDPVLSRDSVQDSARAMAAVVAHSLAQGYDVSIRRQTQAVTDPRTELVRLQFTDGANYNLREYVYATKAEGTGAGEIGDIRRGQSAGAPLTNFYNQAYLGPSGWVRCDDTVPLTYTSGVPSRTLFCGVQMSVGARKNVSVAGQTLASVFNGLLSDPLNFINVGQTDHSGLLSALGATATFPDGSAIRAGFSVNLNRPLYINSLTTDALPGITSLEQMASAFPSAGVNLATGAGTLGLGILDASQFKLLRVAFADAGNAVQFFSCDTNAEFTSRSNCLAGASGSYRIETDNGVRVMRFEGHPATTMNHIRMYAEVKNATQVNAFTSGDSVFQVRQNKGRLEDNASQSKRFNGTASRALMDKLGI